MQAREHFERDYLAKLLKITAGNVSQAARIAQRNRTEFYKLLNKHHLVAENYREEQLIIPLHLAIENIDTKQRNGNE